MNSTFIEAHSAKKSNTWHFSHKANIGTDVHYENPPQPNETPHFENLLLDICRILWCIKIVIDSMHTFLLGGVGCLAYVRRDPPVHTVRFVRYVALIGDYYALLRSRFALCLYGFCRMALQLLSILERDERQLYASSSLFVFCRLRKNSNYTAPRKSDTLISYFRAK